MPAERLTGVWAQQLPLVEKRAISNRLLKHHRPGLVLENMISIASEMQASNPRAFQIPAEGLDLGQGLSLRLINGDSTVPSRFALFSSVSPEDEPIEVTLHSPGRIPGVEVSNVEGQQTVALHDVLQHLFFTAPEAIQNLSNFLSKPSFNAVAHNPRRAVNMKFLAARFDGMLKIRQRLSNKLAAVQEAEAQRQIEEAEREIDLRVGRLMISALDEADSQAEVLLNDHQTVTYTYIPPVREIIGADIELYMLDMHATGEREGKQKRRRLRDTFDMHDLALGREVTRKGMNSQLNRVDIGTLFEEGRLERNDLLVVVALLQRSGIVFSNNFMHEVRQLVQDGVLTLERIGDNNEHIYYGFVRDLHGNLRLIEAVAPEEAQRDDVDQILSSPLFREQLDEFADPFGAKRLGRVIITPEVNEFDAANVEENARQADADEKLRGQVRVWVSPDMNSAGSTQEAAQGNGSSDEVIATDTVLYTFEFQ